MSKREVACGWISRHCHFGQLYLIFHHRKKQSNICYFCQKIRRIRILNLLYPKCDSYRDLKFFVGDVRKYFRDFQCKIKLVFQEKNKHSVGHGIRYCGRERFYRARLWGMYFARIFRIFCGISCLLSTAYRFVSEIVLRLTFPFKISKKSKRKVVTEKAISINMAVHEKLFVDSVV